MSQVHVHFDGKVALEEAWNISRLLAQDISSCRIGQIVLGSDGTPYRIRALDAGEWKEAQHPRGQPGNPGQFASSPGGEGSKLAKTSHPQSVVKTAVSKTLKQHGYQKQGKKSEGGHFVYKHPKGSSVTVGAHKPDVKVLYAFHHAPTGQEGFGAEKLHELLSQYHDGSGKPEPAALESKKKTVQEVIKASQQPAAPQPGVGNIKIPSGYTSKVTPTMNQFGFKPTKENMGSIEFKNDNGDTIHIAKESSGGLFDWVYSPIASSSKQGSGISNLKGKLLANSNTLTKSDPVKPQSTPIKLNVPPGAKIASGPLKTGANLGSGYEGAQKWTTTYGDTLYTGVNSENWIIITKNNGNLTKGSGQQALNAAFEALHPRGAGGKFISKPGELVPSEDWSILKKEINDLGGNSIPPEDTTFYSEYTFSETYPEEVFITKHGDWEYTGPDGNHQNGSGLESLVEVIKNNHAKLAETKTTTSAPPPPPKQAIADEPLLQSTLKQVGPQLGSNPGAQYEDNVGNKYYIKEPKTNDHSKNELLAAALFGAAGGNTLQYHTVLNDQKINVGTKMQTLKANNLSQLTPERKTEAKKDFALHAWLANWDAVGLTGDNIGIDEAGKVVPLDFGGSLLYRAKGEPKGDKFNEKVDEWDSLRDPAKNYQAAELYGDMTAQELKESAKALDNISDQTISDLVDKYGPGDVYKKSILKDTLIKRRDAIKTKAAGIAPNAQPTPPPKAVINPSYLRKTIASWNPGDKPTSAVEDYKGSGYYEMNTLMRFMSDFDDPRINAITEWLDKAKSKETVTLYRGVKKEYLEKISYFAKEGRSLKDEGFISLSTEIAVAQNFAAGGGLVMKVTVPAGSKIATVYGQNQTDHEQEILAQRGSRFKITKWDKNTSNLKSGEGFEFELDQSHLGQE